MNGNIHSIQSLGTLDGPGVRFVVFLQGCPLRCGCCHNPDTWEMTGGTVYSAEDIVKKVTRFREYFGADGGITLSGGEPLMQASFAHEVFALCHAEGINTCLDTSGCVMNDEVLALLDETDRVLLDIKYTNDEDYRKYVGCSMKKPLMFLERLNEKKIPTTLRQVIIPTKNDTEESVRVLSDIAARYDCVDKIELLPFRKMCTVKYEQMNIPFPFADLPEPTGEKMSMLKQIAER